MNIVSCVGTHEICIFENAEPVDPRRSKFKGGALKAVIPFSGKSLNAVFREEELEPLCFNGTSIPLNRKTVTAIDPLPEADDDTFFVVSGLYVSACKQLGMDTSKLLTISGTVYKDDLCTVKGCTGLTAN